MRADLLHVVAVFSNPRRYKSREQLARAFIAHMRDSGVRLTFVEHAFGGTALRLQRGRHRPAGGQSGPGPRRR